MKLNERQLDYIRGAIIFIAGGFTGGLVASQILKTKYERLVEEEVESVRRVMRLKYKEQTEAAQAAAEAAEAAVEETTEYTQYADQVRDLEYNPDPHGSRPEVKIVTDKVEVTTVSDHDEPFAITQDEFEDEYLNHHKISLAYYVEADHLVNEADDEVIEPSDRDRLFGRDSFLRFGFGSDDPDALYIRNFDRGEDYEILRVPHGYPDLR